MEEVRSYWQVAGISHFCNLFNKPFKLPVFEPEELEQAFILEIPVPPELKLQQQQQQQQERQDKVTNSNGCIEELEENEEDGSKSPVQKVELEQKPIDEDENTIDDDERGKQLELGNNSPTATTPQPPKERTSLQQKLNSYDEDDPDYVPDHGRAFNQAPETTQQQQENKESEPKELHLLVKLAVALIKPHFSTKITHLNWETYLKRLVDTYWVDLENYPSPFVVPSLTQDDTESYKNLTFNELPLSDKIDLFYALCDYRFWIDDSSEAIKDYSIDELRFESIGKDTQGYEYWYFSGTRLFRENKELSQDLTSRAKRIKELEYELIELERTRLIREEEEKKKAEQDRARQLTAEAREAKLAAKRQQQEQETQSKKRKSAPQALPPRTGLRERRTSATSNNTTNNPHSNQREPEQQSSRTTRSRLAKAQPPSEPEEQQVMVPAEKSTRSSTKNSRKNDSNKKNSISNPSKLSPEEECKAELEKLRVTQEDRAKAWQMHCDSLEDWENFAVKFEGTKSINEKYLSNHVNEVIMPAIRAIYAKRAAEARRKEKELMLSLTSRRVSTRIISKKTQEEEEERQALIHEAELRRKKVEAETRLRAELEKEMRIRQNRFVINGGTTNTSSVCSEEAEELNGRYNTRLTKEVISNSNGIHEFDGIIHPDNLSDFYEAIELVIDTVRTSKHAWPFVDPVPETVPGYYDLIKNPMDLRKLRTKIEFREYRSLIELEKDFQLLVNNCERFNGPKNVYTKMVYKLWKSFKRNVKLYLERELSMDEYETFVYPPPPKLPPPPALIPVQEVEKESIEVPPESDNLQTLDEEDVKPVRVESPHKLQEPVVLDLQPDIEMEIVLDEDMEEVTLSSDSPMYQNDIDNEEPAEIEQLNHVKEDLGSNGSQFSKENSPKLLNSVIKQEDGPLLNNSHAHESNGVENPESPIGIKDTIKELKIEHISVLTNGDKQQSITVETPDFEVKSDNQALEREELPSETAMET